MSWKISFYNSKVEKLTLGFPSGILANFLHIVELIEEFGPSIGRPYIGTLGNGLYEIRARGKEGIGRSIYCTIKGTEIVILKSFIKKSNKTPINELRIAKQRQKEILR